jgi:undecaprenyl-diphosphatase
MTDVHASRDPDELDEPAAPPPGPGHREPPVTPAVKRRRRLAATIAVAGGVVFVVLALLVPLPFAAEFDAAVLRVLRQLEDPRLTRGGSVVAETARDLTALGGTVVLAMVVALVAAYLAVDRRGRDAIAVLAASGGGVVLDVLLKLIFGRERPSVVPHLVAAHSGSFPSGHSMLAAIVYPTLGVMLARFAKHRGTQVLPIAAAVAITVLVGGSRLVLGVHYPTDVLAGWAAGAAWAGVSWIAVDRLARKGTVEGRRSGEPETHSR